MRKSLPVMTTKVTIPQQSCRPPICSMQYGASSMVSVAQGLEVGPAVSMLNLILPHVEKKERVDEEKSTGHILTHHRQSVLTANRHPVAGISQYANP